MFIRKPIVILFILFFINVQKVQSQFIQPIKNDLGKYRLNFLPGASLASVINQSKNFSFNNLLKNLDFHIVYNSRPKYDVSKNYNFHQLMIGLNFSNMQKSLSDSSFYNNYNFISSQYIGMASYAWNKMRLTFNGQRSRATKSLRQRYNESEFSLQGYFAAPRWSQDSLEYGLYAGQIQVTYLQSQTSYWNFYTNGRETDFYLRYGFALNLNGYYLQNTLPGYLEAHYYDRPASNLPIFGGMSAKLFLQFQLGNETLREAGNITVFTNLSFLFLKDRGRYAAVLENQLPNISQLFNIFNIQYNLPLSFVKNYSKTMYTRYTPID